MLFEVPLPPEYIARMFSSSTSGGSQNKSVRGSATFASPNCTFCDVAGDQNINAETGLHLFLECEQVESTVNYIFDMFTGINGFEYSRREYFSTFERRNFSIAKNYLLTIISKLIMKILWDCRNHFSAPDRLKCWTVLSDELKVLKNSNKKFENLLEASGFNID